MPAGIYTGHAKERLDRSFGFGAEPVQTGSSLARMTIRWMTAFIDRPPAPFEGAVEFWMEATGSKLSEERGEHGEFATLLPSGGDAYLRVQRVETGGGSHLDVHVDDIDRFVARAEGAGAEVQRGGQVPALLTSPAGMVCCVVSHHGESLRAGPLLSPGGALNVVDQICIDIPATEFKEECIFWSAVTGWMLQSSSARSEFKFLLRPGWSPLRVLLQRREDDDGPARAHLDIATDEVDVLVDDHLHLGANVSEKFAYWTSMTDPAGLPYCITARNPRTGLLTTPTAPSLP